jgi:hypothetical protein
MPEAPGEGTASPPPASPLASMMRWVTGELFFSVLGTKLIISFPRRVQALRPTREVYLEPI